jgi:ubiquitin C-terminal hydrolase
MENNFNANNFSQANNNNLDAKNDNLNNNVNNINNNMNNINNSINNNIYFNLLIKPIYNYNINIEGSYINTVLQSFIHLDCVNYWIKIINNTGVMNKIDCCLTKEFYLIFISLLPGHQNQVDSTNLIFHFQNKIQSVYNKEIAKDPYHFYFYFLDLLHLENNNPQNKFYNIDNYRNQNIEEMKNDQLMLRKYAEYFQQTQNSIISDYFFNTEKYYFKCICSKIYYYGSKKIICFDVDKFQIYRNLANAARTGHRLTLDECFLCYQGGYKNMCPNCGNHNAFSFTKLFTSSKVIIISFKRQNHYYKGDINFGLNLSLSNYVIQNTLSRNKYILKSIICAYYENNKIKYFADVLIDNNWIRFTDTMTKKLNNLNELYLYEPQMLIYELEKEQTNFMNPFYSQANIMNNNNFYNPMNEQIIMARMQQMQMMKMFQIIQQNLMLNQFIMRIRNYNNIINNNNNNNMYISLTFLIIPDNWDNSPQNSIKIVPQITLNDTIEKAIDNFFIKLQKPEQAITKFKLNGIEIYRHSQDILRNLGINENSIIYAIRAPNFDALKCT